MFFILCFLPFIFTSCKNNQADLVLTLENDTIKILDLKYKTSNELDYKRHLYNLDTNYLEKSSNIIRYKIKNNSKKKYLLKVNYRDIASEELINSYPDEKNHLYRNYELFFNLLNNNLIVDSDFNYINHKFYNENPYSKVFKSQYVIDSINLKYLNEVHSYKKNLIFDIFRESIVIYPNETKYFSSLINLPIRNPYDRYNAYSLIKENDDVKYECELKLVHFLHDANKNLTKEDKKEIEENGYTIFDGVLESNKVPVKLIPFEDKKTEVLKSQED